MKAEIIAAVPVLPASDVRVAIDFYVQKLGFSEDFAHNEPPDYAGISRGGIQLHLCMMNNAQTIAEQTMVRFRVQNIDALYEEFKPSGSFHPNTVLKEMVWGTREFTVLDPDGVCVTFFEGE